MKKAYVRPAMNAEMFVANEYVAACWSIYCNVPQGTGYREVNDYDGYQEAGDYVWVDSERVRVNVSDQRIASGQGCGTTHEVSGISAAGPSANALWQTSDGTVLDVFYFNAKGQGTSNHHFCTLSAVVWDKNPNASN